MVGPGLLFALALLSLLSPAARAERSVGLDARGVDPMAAVDNRDGLDVRDELGRPVSAQKVLRDLKEASAARAAQNAYASALPKAKAVLPALELAAGVGLRLVQFAVSLPAALAVASMPSAGPKILAVLLVLLGAVAAVRAAAARACPSPLPVRLGRCCPEVLRC